MALCLPLAVLLGYFLAEPMESGSMAVIVLVMFVLAVPLLMKWHHPILVLSWNACITPVFLPGQPLIWLPVAVASLAFAILNRSVDPDSRFIYVPSIANALLLIGAVTLITAWMNGGIGLRTMGGSQYGGRNYIYIFMAVAGFFAFCSMRIAPEKAPLYVAMFFLSGLTGIMPNIIYKLGPAFYSLFSIFPASMAVDQAREDYALAPGIFRIYGLAYVGPALFCYLFARYGIRGILELRKPFRLLFFVVAALCCMASGFRSSLILFGLTFAALFYFEGLHKTRLLPVFLGTALVTIAIMLPNADKLPWVVQRTISFLPVKVDPIAQDSATTSTEWRLEIWKRAIPQIPKYLLMGKGYAMDPNEVYLTANPMNPQAMRAYDLVSLTGDYHNGPISVVIPVGIWGTIAFIWFLISGGRYLYNNHRRGNPQLQRINTFLFAFFFVKIVVFCAVFGSFFSDLYTFTGLLGLSVSLNGAPEAVAETEVTEAEQPALEAFS